MVCQKMFQVGAAIVAVPQLPLTSALQAAAVQGMRLGLVERVGAAALAPIRQIHILNWLTKPVAESGDHQVPDIDDNFITQLIDDNLVPNNGNDIDFSVVPQREVELVPSVPDAPGSDDDFVKEKKNTSSSGI